jgi:hypothetical protein
MLSGVTIPQEEAEMMKDPVANFLGWQANRDENTPVGQKRLFNAPLMKEAIAFMTSQLAAIRAAKAAGNVSIKDAIAATNRTALENFKPQPKTNDPMLQAAQAQAQPQVNAEKVASANDAPFQTPPAAAIDPITGTPVQPQQSFAGFGQQQTQEKAPFTAPSFGFGQAPGGSGLPF